MNKYDEMLTNFYLWVYINLINVFGILGTFLAVVASISIFLGYFALGICLVIISLLFHYVDNLIKVKK